MHVTMRRGKGVPNLRTDLLRRLLQQAMRDTMKAREERFRVAEYSIQADHVHLVVEADDHDDLSRGMRSFAIRVARRVNRLIGRKRGKVWADRYHSRELTSPRDVRNALVYVLANHLKHGETDVGVIDPCSSGPWFQGWITKLEPPSEAPCVTRATTWLLDWGWHRGKKYIFPGEVPRALRR